MDHQRGRRKAPDTSVNCTTIDDFLKYRRDRVKPMKDTLGDQPTQLGREALEPIKSISGGLLLGAGNVFQRIGGSVSIAGAA